MIIVSTGKKIFSCESNEQKKNTFWINKWFIACRNGATVCTQVYQFGTLLAHYADSLTPKPIYGGSHLNHPQNARTQCTPHRK